MSRETSYFTAFRGKAPTLRVLLHALLFTAVCLLPPRGADAQGDAIRAQRDNIVSPGGADRTDAGAVANAPFALPQESGPPPSRFTAKPRAAKASNLPPDVLGPAASPPSSSQQNDNRDSIPLEPPEDTETLSKPPSSPTSAIWTVVSSLAIVLGLFIAVVYLTRRTAVGGPVALPKDAFEVLGRSTLTGRQQAQVVRFGDKLILLAVSANGVESLAEITTPAEVERIAGLCQQQRPDSVTNSFRQVLGQFSRERAPQGFVAGENDSRGPSEESLSEFEKLV